MPIDRTGTRPVHLQVQDELRSLIGSGQYPPGARLPTELQLADRFRVNRLTIRHALAELHRNGIVVPRQGAGTFVAPARNCFDVEISASDWTVEHERVTRAAAQSGRSVREELLSAERNSSCDDAVSALGTNDLLRLETVHHIDDEPAIHSQYWLHARVTPVEAVARSRQGFSAHVLRELVGEDMYYTWRSFDATAATHRQSRLLRVSAGAALLRRCGLNSNAAGAPLLYLQRDAPSGRMRILLRSAPPPR